MKKFVLIEDHAEKADPTKEPLYSLLICDVKAWPVPFLSKNTAEIIKGFFQNDFEKTLKDLDRLQTIWKALLVDAIHFLKINDKREREYFSKDKKKTTMDTDGAETAAINSVYGIEELFGYFKQFSDFRIHTIWNRQVLPRSCYTSH